MDIKEAQKINLLLLKEFDRFCKKHDIKYRLEAGTLLGAIRHKGFIPWDDDCDVALTRKEYDKLKDALRSDNFSSGFRYESVGDNIDKKHFHDFVDRLFYVEKIYRDDDKYKKVFGGMYKYLWLDVFVLDDVIPSRKEKNYLYLKILYGLSMGHRYKIYYSDYSSVLEKIEVFVLSNIGRLINLDTLYNKYKNVLKENAYKKTDKDIVSRHYYSNYPIVYIEWEINKKYEDEYIYVDFEDTTLPVSKNYDELLTDLYGDYMVLPSEKDRVPSHIDIMR